MKEITDDEIIEMMNKLIEFYEKINSIQDYFIEVKKEKIKDININDKIDTLFNDVNMSPMDMDISIEVINSDLFNPLVQSICSMPLNNQIGRQINIGVKENNTNKWLGFTRIASPVLTIKPRNILFNEVINTKIVNRHMINGCQIIPVQPFGYNYLGGKLLALVSTSHELRNLFNEQYKDKCDIIHWETTSLYGDIKGLSQYDGMKPYIKYVDLTESENLIFPTDDVYIPILKRLREVYGKEEYNGYLILMKEPDGLVKSSPKKREFDKCISIIKNRLKDIDPDIYHRFSLFIKERMKTKTKKRFYYSNYGFENTKDYMLDNSIELKKGENYHKFYLCNLIQWWKNKSYKRWMKLKEENRIKTELEIYTNDTLQRPIEMIR